MRQTQYEESTFDEEGIETQGARIPFANFQDWDKFRYLVPEADCDTRGGRITAWRDARPQPTYDEIEAVTDEVRDQMLANEDADDECFADVVQKLVRICFRQENEILQLKGLQPITKRKFLRRLRDQ